MFDRVKIAQIIIETVPVQLEYQSSMLDNFTQIWQHISDNRLWLDGQHFGMSVQWRGSFDAQKTVTRMQPVSYGIMGIDGSQIYPDRHQGTHWYVINVGSIIIEYGTERSSVYRQSSPIVITDTKAFNNRTAAVDAYRTVCELREGCTRGAESIVLIDGPLTWWCDDPDEHGSRFDEYCAILQQYADARITVAGYVSMPRSRDLVRALCQATGNVHEEYTSVTDADLLNLFPTHTMPWFSTFFCAASTDQYAVEVRPWFMYCVTEYEIVRIEVPYYVVVDSVLSEKLMQCIVDQILKGNGYPVCLSEAHEQAVVTEADRLFFYQCIQQRMGMYTGTKMQSHKSVKKRITAV